MVGGRRTTRLASLVAERASENELRLRSDQGSDVEAEPPSDAGKEREMRLGLWVLLVLSVR